MERNFNLWKGNDMGYKFFIGNAIHRTISGEVPYVLTA